MEGNRDISERSAVDNFAFGIVIVGVLGAAGGVLLTAPGIAIGGLVLVTIGLSYFGVKQWLVG